MKKKVLLVIVTIFACLILVGCNSKTTKDSNSQNNNTKENSNTEKENATKKEAYEYDYKEGVLTQIVDEEGNPKQTDFIINGVILVGNRHSYDGLNAGDESIIETLSKNGYKKEGINSSFYLNEYIEFYLDTDYKGNENDVRILIVPHKPIEELEKVDLELLASEKGAVMNYIEPDNNNYKYVNEGYVSIDYPEGKYDILFTYKGKIAYFISIDETKEPTN